MNRHVDNSGKPHRLDGPAIENPDGSFVWYKHGLIHREDGPAVRLVFIDGRIEEQFWYNGTQVE